MLLYAGLSVYVLQYEYVLRILGAECQIAAGNYAGFLLPHNLFGWRQYAPHLHCYAFAVFRTFGGFCEIGIEHGFLRGR